MTKHSSKKAQAAMEYLFVVGFAFALLAPIILLYYSQSASFEEEVMFTQARNAVEDITIAANNVYYLGEPSKTTIQVRLPDNTQSITIHNDTIVLLLDTSSGPYEIARPARTTITGSISPSGGVKNVVLQATSEGVSLHEE